MTKSVADIIEGATDEEIQRWFPDIVADRWPADMPVPDEAFGAVWPKLQRRFLALQKYKPGKRG